MNWCDRPAALLNARIRRSPASVFYMREPEPRRVGLPHSARQGTSLQAKGHPFLRAQSVGSKVGIRLYEADRAEFHTLVVPIIEGKVSTILPEQKPVVDRMYALSLARAMYRDLDEQDTQINGVSGHALTKEQESGQPDNSMAYGFKCL
jgi:hypothetical protein